jgi:hypothetical protein
MSKMPQKMKARVTCGFAGSLELFIECSPQMALERG